MYCEINQELESTGPLAVSLYLLVAVKLVPALVVQ